MSGLTKRTSRSPRTDDRGRIRCIPIMPTLNTRVSASSCKTLGAASLILFVLGAGLCAGADYLGTTEFGATLGGAAVALSRRAAGGEVYILLDHLGGPAASASATRSSSCDLAAIVAAVIDHFGLWTP